jgi:hypothetical protein
MGSSLCVLFNQMSGRRLVLLKGEVNNKEVSLGVCAMHRHASSLLTLDPVQIAEAGLHRSALCRTLASYSASDADVL